MAKPNPVMVGLLHQAKIGQADPSYKRLSHLRPAQALRLANRRKLVVYGCSPESEEALRYVLNEWYWRFPFEVRKNLLPHHSHREWEPRPEEPSYVMRTYGYGQDLTKGQELNYRFGTRSHKTKKRKK